jgi:hypothetical protein
MGVSHLLCRWGMAELMNDDFEVVWLERLETALNTSLVACGDTI